MSRLYRDAPTAKQVIATRERFGLTQREAAAMLQVSLRTYVGWEIGDTVMHPVFFDWFTQSAGRSDKMAARAAN